MELNLVGPYITSRKIFLHRRVNVVANNLSLDLASAPDTRLRGEVRTILSFMNHLHSPGTTWTLTHDEIVEPTTIQVADIADNQSDQLETVLKINPQ